jgi:hypothetical protein
VGEGESSAVILIIHETGLTEDASAISETYDGYSFSQGEKARMRASHPPFTKYWITYTTRAAYK